MDIVNRTMAVVRAKQPMVDWINRTDPDDHVTEREVNEDSTAFLLPDYDYEDDMRAYVEANFDIIFDNELNLWFTDDSLWPSPRTIDVFHEWFDIEIHSMVVDLADDPLVAYDDGC